MVGEGRYRLFPSGPGDEILGPEVYVLDHVSNENDFVFVPSDVVGVSFLAPKRGERGPWCWGRAPRRYWWKDTQYANKKSP